MCFGCWCRPARKACRRRIGERLGLPRHSVLHLNSFAMPALSHTGVRRSLIYAAEYPAMKQPGRLPDRKLLRRRGVMRPACAPETSNNPTEIGMTPACAYQGRELAQSIRFYTALFAAERPWPSRTINGCSTTRA